MLAKSLAWSVLYIITTVAVATKSSKAWSACQMNFLYNKCETT